MKYPSTIENLIECFSKLPGIGSKTAERLALSTLSLDDEVVSLFSKSLKDVKTKIKRLFMDDYLFVGSHEEKARKLTSEIDNASGAKIFSSAVELYMAAAVIGCHFDRRSPREKGDKTYRIMQNQFSNHYYSLLYIIIYYQLVLFFS